MENTSTINTSTDLNFPALVIDDDEVMKQVDQVADMNSPILLTSESGTGKELVASAIHNRSSRRDQPFVTVNCASIPAESIEGLLEDADGGTIFLKEITETTPSFQEKLLRFLQTGEFTRVDSNDVQTVNVRVLAASGRDVEHEVVEGRFSKDLFDCFSSVSIDLHEQPETANDDWVTLSVIEGRYVARVLEHTHGNKQAAARVLAVDRKTLDRMIKRHHIDSHHLKAMRAKAFHP